MTLYNANDHWAFLEQIEAPMWVDLTLEPNSNNKDVHEEWFGTSHLIHQSCSTELKSAVSGSGEEDMVIDSGLEESSSPNSTNSVSSSRGNEYKSKKWKQNGCKSSKKHDLVKVGTETLSKSDTSAVHESSSSNNVVTSEKNRDARFLEFLKSSLRKSYATTKNPSRVGVHNDGRESNGCKSSVGSSRVVKETTPDSKDVVKMNQTIKSKEKVANMPKSSTFQVGKSRKVDKTRPVYHGSAKSKVTPKVKVRVNGINGAEAAGKENAREKTGLNNQSGARSVVWVQKRTAQHKEDKTGSSTRLKGNLSDRNEKKATNGRPHFR